MTMAENGYLKTKYADTNYDKKTANKKYDTSVNNI